ncbi:MAG: quinone-dependent dihydroorotate dehydrogenase [Fimbriimonadaceae bacterium]|nr:quinone-dependent dihydroorotate dehydrogenase [Fimbriimonadaceae bacterium]
MTLYEWLRPLLFRLDAERAHELGLWAIAHGFAPTFDVPDRPVERFGVQFRNPLGLAAGFDKNAVAVDFWADLGFGFVEVGTVTRHAQPGNPKPRMFRIPEWQSLVNRLGFNNEGADAVARRLERSTPSLPVGVNIGKSKVTPLEEAASDYAYSFRRLKDLATYVVVNVSSPNTPGLRSLQDRPALTAILSELKAIDQAKPLLVKIAPDLGPEALSDVAQVVQDLDLAGVVATNTTLRRPGPDDPGYPMAELEGGLSGRLLQPRADHALEVLRRILGPEKVVVGVGGVTDGESARRKLALGADLIQAYTGFVYGGPEWPGRIVASLPGT